MPASSSRIEAAIGELVPGRGSVADARLELVEAPDLDAAASLANAVAPEHLQVDCAEAAEVAARIRTAGCVFVGAFGATAFGDYAAGSNHVLPTGGAGRFTGPLGPATFRRRISPGRARRRLRGSPLGHRRRDRPQRGFSRARRVRAGPRGRERSGRTGILTA